MSRSGYVNDYEHPECCRAFRARVAEAILSDRGQKFLRDLAKSLDALDKRVLITDKLIDESGDVCPIGAVCKSRGLDVGNIDCDDPGQVGDLVGISPAMAVEIEFINDEESYVYESSGQRWTRMRRWVERKIVK